MEMELIDANKIPKKIGVYIYAKGIYGDYGGRRREMKTISIVIQMIKDMHLTGQRMGSIVELEVCPSCTLSPIQGGLSFR